MNRYVITISLLTLLITSGCVRRTTTVNYGRRSDNQTKRSWGATEQGNVVGEKTIWFWQKDFRKPK